MNWLIKHVVFLHLVALVVALGWIHGGTRADWLRPVIPWLALFILEWLLVYPPMKINETLFDARKRIWQALLRDPLTWIGLLFTLVLVIPLLNVAALPYFNKAVGQWIVPQPPITWLPFCADAKAHSVLLIWFIPAMVAVLATKHGLLKRTKRWLFELICWNGAALAMLGFLQLATETKSILWMTPMPDYFFSTFGYPNLAGAYFTLIGAFSFGLWFQHMAEATNLIHVVAQNAEEQEASFWTLNRMLVPTLFCFAAAISTLSRAAILLCGVVFFAFVIYTLIYIWHRVSAGARMTIMAVIAAMIFTLTSIFFIFNLGSLKNELKTITWTAIVERVTGRGYYHARVATEIFNHYPVYGVGGWGYPKYLHVYITPEERKNMQIVGGINVHNDIIQFLAEQGVVGFGLMVLFVLGLSGSLGWQIILLCRTLPPSAGIRNRIEWFNAIPPPVVGVWVGTTATLCHSLGDLPFRSPAVLIVWLLSFTCVTGWIPALKKKGS